MNLEVIAGVPVEDLVTPVPIIDADVVSRNIARVQTVVTGMGKNFRPHIKTHKLPRLAHLQLAAGAIGINCQKVSEAEVFASAGCEDILITYNVLGRVKLEALRALTRRARISVVADSEVVIAGLAEAFSSDAPLTVLVECDTSLGRCGVQSPQAAVDLALCIDQAPSLRFGGLLTYPNPDHEFKGEQFFAATLSLLREHGLDCPTVSYGGSPSLARAAEVPSATEYRAGSYIYNDRALLEKGAARPEDCAMHVLATVVSRPTPDRAVIDAGSKSLSSDLLGLTGFGTLIDYPGSLLVSLSEEHGVVDLSACTGARPAIGEVTRVLPNHCCVVTNLFDAVVFHSSGRVLGRESVAARGTVW